MYSWPAGRRDGQGGLGGEGPEGGWVMTRAGQGWQQGKGSGCSVLGDHIRQARRSRMKAASTKEARVIASSCLL